MNHGLAESTVEGKERRDTVPLLSIENPWVKSMVRARRRRRRQRRDTRVDINWNGRRKEDKIVERQEVKWGENGKEVILTRESLRFPCRLYISHDEPNLESSEKGNKGMNWDWVRKSRNELIVEMHWKTTRKDVSSSMEPRSQPKNRNYNRKGVEGYFNPSREVQMDDENRTIRWEIRRKEWNGTKVRRCGGGMKEEEEMEKGRGGRKTSI